MQLKLSLSQGRIVWALNNPADNGYIKEVNETGTQECVLILTGEEKRSIILEDYPQWAQKMILSSIKSGDILNEGEDPFLSEEQRPGPKASKPKTKKTRSNKSKTKKKA